MLEKYVNFMLEQIFIIICFLFTFTILTVISLKDFKLKTFLRCWFYSVSITNLVQIQDGMTEKIVSGWLLTWKSGNSGKSQGRIVDDKVRGKSGKFMKNCQSQVNINLFCKCLRTS